MINWYVVIIIDNIRKLFAYAGFIVIPLLFILLLLVLKRSQDKLITNYDFLEEKKTLTMIYILFAILIGALVSVRTWGPYFYKPIISLKLNFQKDKIEQELENKYNKNFEFVSKGNTEMEKDSGDVLGGNVDSDYSVKYIFIDDDGAYALVIYKKNSMSIEYPSLRNN